MLIARLLRLLIVVLAALALGWASFWLYWNRPWLALAGVLAISAAHAWVLAAEFVLLAIVVRRAGEAAPGVARLLRAWWVEIWLDVRAFAWQQPFRSGRYPDQLTPAGRRGVVLVHGFFCNRGIWNPWQRWLRESGVPTIAVNLDATFGSIEAGAPIVEQAVLAMHRATGLAPVLVAHSMGGLVVRAWLDARAGDRHVHRIVTVGTPHQGTWLARFTVGTNTAQMRRSGAWLRHLAAREPASRAALFTCFYSDCDNVVFPASTATLPGADNRCVAGAAHVELLYQPEVRAELTRWLDLESAKPAEGAGSSPRNR